MRIWNGFVALAAVAAVGALALGPSGGPAGAAGASPTIMVSDDAAGVAAGGSFTFTVAVTGSAGSTPTGTVAWVVTGPSTVVCAPSTLNGSGEGTCTVGDAKAGTYSATATYSGDADYGGGSGSDTTAISKIAKGMCAANVETSSAAAA